MSRLIEVIECSECPYRKTRQHRNGAGEWVVDAYCAEIDLEISEGIGYDHDFPDFCPLGDSESL